MPQSRSKNAIIVFAKTPEIGKVKTRLARDTSPEFAVEFYEVCLQYLFNELHDNQSDILLYLTPDSDENYFHPFKPQNICYQVSDNNLGHRMASAFEAELEHFEKVLLIGSDIPSLDNRLLSMALDSLDNHPTVIGPAEDGGYYLIGFRQGNFINCFEDIEWSTETVLSETLRKFEGIPLFLLPYCRDVDTLEDLQSLHNEKCLPPLIQTFLTKYPDWFEY